MSPLYVRLEPEEIVSVNVRNSTNSYAIILVDDVKVDRALEETLRMAIAEHGNDDDTQPVCDNALQPSSLKEICDNSTAVSDPCNPETSVESRKTLSITDTSECCEINGERSALLTITEEPQNITASSVQLPDSSTTVESVPRQPDEPEKSAMNKIKKSGKVRKSKKKFKLHGMVDETAERSNITEHESTNVSTSELNNKSILILFESDESIEPVEAVENVIKKKKNKKNKKHCVEGNKRTKKKTVRKLILSGEEEISVESKLESSTSKVSKKTDKNDKQKDPHGNHDGETVVKEKITSDDYRQTTAPPTEHAKLPDKQQSSQLENLERRKASTLPVSIKREKSKGLSKLFKRSRTHCKHNEQPAPAKEFQVEQSRKKIDEGEQSALENMPLVENWIMHPVSPIPKTTETLQQRWAETGLIDPLDKHSYNGLRRKRPLSNVQETSETLDNPPASVSESVTEYSVDETILANRQISGETTIAHEHLPSPFLVPPVSPRKRMRTNTDIEQQTQPLQTNLACDSYEDGTRNTSEESTAIDKHSFKIVDTSPTGRKRIEKVEIADIETSNETRNPYEDDSISISTESLCDLDDMEPALATNNTVSEWIGHSRGHATDNATLQNTTKQPKERVPPFKYPRINVNTYADDEPDPSIRNSVEDSIDLTEYTTRTQKLDKLDLFEDTCSNILRDGICKKRTCVYKHELPRDWQITLRNMPKECLRNLYNNIKHNRHLFKKVFPIVVKQLALQQDCNSLTCLVTDVLALTIDSDRAVCINVIIDAMRSAGMTFNDVIEIIFNSIPAAGQLKDQLTDVLINICTEQADISNSCSSIKVLMDYRNYRVNADSITRILRKCLIRNDLQKEFCMTVYRDLVSRISDDQFGIRFESLLNDYIKCMRTLGLVNEAQVLAERFAVPTAPSSGYSDAALADVPSTSATEAADVEKKQMYKKSTVQQAIFTDNMPQLRSLILEYKDGDLTDELLETCLNAMHESTHDFGVLFGNLCEGVTVCQDVKMDKSLEYVLQTIGTNLIMYAVNNNKWDQAHSVYQKLRDLYNDADIKNVKMFLCDKPSYIKWLLIICLVYVKHHDSTQAWELFKVNGLHTSRSWTELADQQHICYRDQVFTALMTDLQIAKQWETAFIIVKYILENNIHELDSIVDSTIQAAIHIDCNVDHITSFMSVCPVWYNRVCCHTVRMMLVKLVRHRLYRLAHKVHRQGCQLKIYPDLIGNEKCLVFSTHYLPEEMLLMVKVFLYNMVKFMPVTHTVVIKAHESRDSIETRRQKLPWLLLNSNTSITTMHVRIVNILNNQIEPPIRVVNKYTHLEITPAELQKHLEERRKCNLF